MRANPSRNTGPELRLRSALHALGLRYRANQALRLDEGRPVLVDVLFPKERLAVFLDGCFWHSCPTHGTTPRANSGYWLPKLRRNAERDKQTLARLESAGWSVLRVWEHEDPADAAARVLVILRRLRGDLR